MQAKNPKFSPARRELLESLDRELRQASGLGTVFSETVASRLGLSPTDLECLDMVMLGERVTAGDLAKATGLTTGAVTGIIDRLEKAGFARRERDPEDRRRVYVRGDPAAAHAAMPYYQSLSEAMAKMLERYSDEEIAFLVDYFARARQVMAGQLEKLAGGNTRSSDRLAAEESR
jgi:DNA-binding MarR family transcriptional regulator